MPPSTEENEGLEEAGFGEELEEEGGDEVMHQGFLNLLKGDAANKKFFVLTREYFTYWDTQEDMENGEPQKALIELTGIKEFKEIADGFELSVEGQKKTLQLQVVEKADLPIWVNHWREQLAESLGDSFQATSTVADAEKAAAEVAAAEEAAEGGEEAAADGEALDGTGVEEEAAAPAAEAAAEEKEEAAAGGGEEAPAAAAEEPTATAAATPDAAAAGEPAKEKETEKEAEKEEAKQEEEQTKEEAPAATATAAAAPEPEASTPAATTEEAAPAPAAAKEEAPATKAAAAEAEEVAEEEEEEAAAGAEEEEAEAEAAGGEEGAEEVEGAAAEEEEEEVGEASPGGEAPRLSFGQDKKQKAVATTFHQGQLLQGEGRTTINVTVSDRAFEVAEGDQSIAKDDIADIQEVTGGFEIHTKSGEARQFFYAEDESDESAWVIALGQMMDGGATSPSPGVPMGSPGAQSAASTAASPPASGKKVVGAGLPAGHRKLREIFDLCGPEAISGNVITRDSFLAACKRSYLVSDFFRLTRVSEGSLSSESTDKMLSILDEAAGTGGDAKARITWDAFRQFHNTYVTQQIGHEEESALDDIKGNSILHEGPLRVMHWPKLDGVREHNDEDWQFNHILFDPASGRAALRQEFAYVKRKFNNPNGKPKKEEPIAAFEEPETAQNAFMDLVSVFGRFYCPVTISYNRKPQQKPGTDEQEEWMKELHGNRVVLIKDTLIKAGIPESMIRVRLVSDVDAPTHTFIFETNHRVRHIRVHSSMMLYVPKLEGAPQNIRVNADEITTVRWGKAGFRLDLQGGENVEVQMLATELPMWRPAIDRLCANGKKLRTAVLQKSLSMNTLEQLRNSVKNGPVVVKAGSGFEVPTDMANEFDASALKAWTAKLPETPTMSGILGLQAAGALTAKYCLLFKDRLDSWTRPIDATQGKKPQGRIWIKEVKEFEIVGSGLVLTVGRRKVGIHTRTAQDLYLWSEALRLAIQECPEASASVGGASAEGSPEKRELPPPPLRRKRSDRSILDVKPPHHKQAPAEPGQASLWHLRSGRGVVINTNVHAPESGQLLASVGDVLIQPVPRPGSASPSPASKITNFDHIPKSPGKDFANKIPGARELGARSEPGAMRWNKITRHRLGTIRSSTSSQPALIARAKSAEPRQAATNIVRDMSLVRPKEAGPPYKITSACRGFEPPPRITSANQFKITEAGRGPTTYLQVRNHMYCGDVDKLRSFGQGSAWAEAQDKRVAANIARKSLSAGPSTSKRR